MTIVLNCEQTVRFEKNPVNFIFEKNLKDGEHVFLSENPWHGEKIATIKNGKLSKLVYKTTEKGVYHINDKIYKIIDFNYNGDELKSTNTFPLIPTKDGNCYKYNGNRNLLTGEYYTIKDELEEKEVKKYFYSNFPGLSELTKSQIDEIFEGGIIAPRSNLNIEDGYYYINNCGYQRLTIKGKQLISLESTIDINNDYPRLVWYFDLEDGKTTYRTFPFENNEKENFQEYLKKDTQGSIGDMIETYVKQTQEAFNARNKRLRTKKLNWLRKKLHSSCKNEIIDGDNLFNYLYYKCIKELLKYPKNDNRYTTVYAGHGYQIYAKKYNGKYYVSTFNCNDRYGIFDFKEGCNLID